MDMNTTRTIGPVDLDLDIEHPVHGAIVVQDADGRQAPLAEFADRFPLGDYLGTRDRNKTTGDAADHIGTAEAPRLLLVVDWGAETIAQRMLGTQERRLADAISPIRRIVD